MKQKLRPSTFNLILNLLLKFKKKSSSLSSQERSVFVGLFLSLSLTSLLYVNCSEVNLSPMPSKPGPQRSEIPEFKICSANQKTETTDKYNFLFVIDMSRSNLGSFTPNQKNSDDWNLSYEFDQSKGTDPTGLRLSAIKAFIQKNTASRFKLIPFSSTISFSGFPELSCEKVFQTATEAESEITKLQDWQKAEIKLYEESKDDYRKITAGSQMNQTNYTIALDCADKALKNEIVNLDALNLLNNYYRLFYVTDGKPKPPDLITEDVIKSYTKTVKDISIFSSITAGFQVVPIYYGFESDPETPQALSILEKIGKAGNWENLKNPENIHAPLYTKEIGTLDFDKIFKTTLYEPSRIIEFNIVNLTARAKDGKLLPDSDMDGLLDIEDPDPLVRRSNSAHLLDSVCEMLGGESSCKSPNTCSQNASTSFGLTDCEFQALSLNTGYDTDFDLIPDLIEVYFKTSLKTNDSQLDYNNKGIINLEKIHQGDDPKAAIELPEEKKINWTRHIEKENPCAEGQETWIFDSFFLPQVPTKAFTKDNNDPRDLNDPLLPFLNHSENENVYFAYYITEPETFNHKKRRLFGHFFTLKVGQKNPPPFAPSDFVLLNEMLLPGDDL